jgi:hypothetical protein
VDAATIVGLLADPARLKVVAALALGARSIEDVAELSGLALKDVALASRRLARAGLVHRAGHVLALHVDRFGAAARAAAPNCSVCSARACPSRCTSPARASRRAASATSLSGRPERRATSSIVSAPRARAATTFSRAGSASRPTIVAASTPRP